MSAEDRASELLAELERKAEAGIAAVRERTQQIKAKLEDGVLNLQSSGPQPGVVHHDPVVDLNWDLETEAAAESQPEAASLASEQEPPLEDFRITAPEPASSFKDELDVATDEF